MGSLGIVQAPAPGPPAQESPRLLRPGLRPFPMRPFPSPKLGLLRCAVGDRPEGGCLKPPFPQEPPCFFQGRALPGLLHGFLLYSLAFFLSFLFFFFFFFFFANFTRAPAARHSPAAANSRVDWAHAPLRSAPLYPQRTGSFRTPRSRTGSAGDEGLTRGAPEVTHPGSVPDHSAVSPSRPRGQGAGGTTGRSGSHGGTQDQATEDQESDLEPAAEGEGTRGGGDQKGAGGGERAPRCRLPAVPAAAAPPAAASIVCDPALPRVAAPPALRLAMPCALWILGICAWLADLARKVCLMLPRFLAVVQPAALLGAGFFDPRLRFKTFPPGPDAGHILFFGTTNLASQTPEESETSEDWSPLA